MSSIRKQSLISSAVVYAGFVLGMINMYLFVRQGGLTKEQYGITTIFIAFANIMFSVASLGMPAFITKFYPYYKAHLKPEKNDQMAIALSLSVMGFFIVVAAGLGLKGLLVDHIFNNSPQLLEYYYWTFPFGFGYTIFMIMEAYSWMERKAVLSNFLKEIGTRLVITILIILLTAGVLRSFDSFVVIYSFTYILLALIIIMFMVRRKRLHLHFGISHVTRRFKTRIQTLSSFVWGGSLIFNVASVFDTIVVAAVMPQGVAMAAILAVGQNMSSLIQAPQRAVVSAAVGPLSEAWRMKDLKRIQLIYYRSSINQLIFAMGMFFLIWLNFDDGISTFKIQGDYVAAKWVFFWFAMYKIVDMGTGVNSQIIGASTFWRFEFISGLALLACALPLNYFLTIHIGLEGPAISNLIAFTVYNSIRFGFLYRKFKMQPFSWKTLYTLLLALIAFLVCYLLFSRIHGLVAMVLRSLCFILIYGTGLWRLRLSPDVQPVLATLLNRMGLKTIAARMRARPW